MKYKLTLQTSAEASISNTDLRGCPRVEKGRLEAIVSELLFTAIQAGNYLLLPDLAKNGE